MPTSAGIPRTTAPLAEGEMGRNKSSQLRVILVYRRRVAGAYSIEALFHTIAEVLRSQVELIEYETGRRWWILWDLWKLRRLKADVYHLTAGINYFALLLPWSRTVLTVPDIGHFLFGLTGFKRWIYKWIWLKGPLHAARSLTAISRETQGMIVSHLGIPRNRIRVIECCFGADFRPVARTFRDECPVLLQLGTRPYKNVPALVEAIRGIRCRLVLVGRLDSGLRKILVESGIDFSNRIDLSAEEIVQQYIDCDIVTFVSLGEGFGVPVIEAQASGRPIVTSNISPLREVAGEGACLVNPLDPADIRDGILRIITDSSYRAGLVERGLVNADRFSPAVISGQYLDLYKETAAS